MGSKAEYHQYGSQILADYGYQPKHVSKKKDISSLFEPLLFVAGTGHLAPQYDEIMRLIRVRKGTAIPYGTPGLVVAPALEIAHEFAEHLGIDPQWRYRRP